MIGRCRCGSYVADGEICLVCREPFTLGTLLLDVTVPGKPKTQGSLYPIGRGKVVHPKSTTQHRNIVIQYLRLAWRGQQPYHGPTGVSTTFTIPRPRKHLLKGGDISPKAPPVPTTRPDGDKLERLVWDALTQSRVLADDSIVVDWTGRKRYGEPGTRIRVTAIDN